MGARVLVVGLDATSLALVDTMVAAGRLPTLARLDRDGARAELDTCLHTLPGAVWPELTTGVSGGKLGLYYHSWQIHTGEAYGRPVGPEDVDTGRYYWNVAARAGRRVAVVDQVQAVLEPASEAVQVTEWGLHDRSFHIASSPAELLDELRAAHGDHPVRSCDAMHRERTEGYLVLRDALLDGLARKADLVIDMLRRDDWDLFACTFAETHCVGHQFWHFGDPSHPDHRPDALPQLRDAVPDVYVAIDTAVGRVIDAAGDGVTVLVVVSHGMGVPTGGFQLMPEIVARLELGTGLANHARLRRVVPAPIRRALRAAVPDGVQTRHKLRAREFEAEGTRALAVKNNRCGGVRLNLIGREPFGTVAPGDEAETLLAEIRRELSALRDPRSGQPIVQSALTATEAFGPDHHHDLPDLLVDFRDDLGVIESCESPRVGRITVPVRTAELPRTGDHLPTSRLWAHGPLVGAGGELPAGSSLDLAPTVLDLLDVALPDWIDGTPLPVSGRATRGSLSG